MEERIMKVNEIFRSISGEVGIILQGTIATFIRFQGCNLNCSWPCDTPHAQSLGDGKEMTVSEIAERVPPHENVVLTGGEPLL